MTGVITETKLLSSKFVERHPLNGAALYKVTIKFNNKQLTLRYEGIRTPDNYRPDVPNVLEQGLVFAWKYYTGFTPDNIDPYCDNPEMCKKLYAYAKKTHDGFVRLYGREYIKLLYTAFASMYGPQRMEKFSPKYTELVRKRNIERRLSPQA